jgi:hypothetical protein
VIEDEGRKVIGVVALDALLAEDRHGLRRRVVDDRDAALDGHVAALGLGRALLGQTAQELIQKEPQLLAEMSPTAPT